MKILDLSAGNRAVWFNKNHPDTTYLDIRTEVNPSIVADSRALPAELGDGFDLVVFDPPHKNNGPLFGMAKTYGCFTIAEIRSTIQGTAKEAHRVTSPNALMAFKWNDHSISLHSVLELLEPYWEPLFGHGINHQQLRGSKTSWAMLRRVQLEPTAPAQPDTLIREERDDLAQLLRSTLPFLKGVASKTMPNVALMKASTILTIEGRLAALAAAPGKREGA